MAREKQLSINDRIRSDPVRLIDDEGQQRGVVALQQALEMARRVDLDLVEISPNVSPSVCRIMDYGKHLYSKSKKRQDAKKKQKQIVVKEIKFRPGTDIGDYTIKLKKLNEFISAGNKAKVTMRFRGREMSHKELGLNMLKRIEIDLQELAEVEQQPLLEGRQMVMVLAPKKV